MAFGDGRRGRSGAGGPRPVGQYLKAPKRPHPGPTTWEEASQRCGCLICSEALGGRPLVDLARCEDDREFWSERAAIREYHGAQPRAVAELGATHDLQRHHARRRPEKTSGGR